MTPSFRTCSCAPGVAPLFFAAHNGATYRVTRAVPSPSDGFPRLSGYQGQCGLSEDLLAVRISRRKKPEKPTGIGLKTPEKAAEALNWTVPQLMGIEPGPDKEKLHTASRLVARLMLDYPVDRKLLSDLLPDWMEAAYGIVHQVSVENPESWNSPESFTAMSSAFVRLMRN